MALQSSHFMIVLLVGLVWKSEICCNGFVMLPHSSAKRGAVGGWAQRLDATQQTSAPSNAVQTGKTKTKTTSTSSSSSSRILPTRRSPSSDAFLTNFFAASDCDNVNTPPSLGLLLQNLEQIASGPDVRGRFVNHPPTGSIASIAHAILGQREEQNDTIAALTPFAAHCLGNAYANMLWEQHKQQQEEEKNLVICIGRDPRSHGTRLADAFARGIQSFQSNDDNFKKIKVFYTQIATTPSIAAFCQMDLADGGVMVTASHLPSDRNGFKFFTKHEGGFTPAKVQELIRRAKSYLQTWQSMGITPPPLGGKGAVYCSQQVDFMPQYANSLKEAIRREVGSEQEKPLEGLKICLNAGHGSGGFFQSVLQDLGADVSSSIHIEPNADFPVGIPNPEYKQMMSVTTQACQKANADLGIMLDTDADRCGFIVPRFTTTTTDDNQQQQEQKEENKKEYQALNRNRLIALLGVVFSKSSPGCTIVTDSVTSEGLQQFLENNLGLNHVRYLKGYANVIGKARQLCTSGQADAQVAIETSGHCAMKENGFLDDGTYTAVKVVSLLARIAKDKNNNKDLMHLIREMKELDEISELRMNILDGSLETMQTVFDAALGVIENNVAANDEWELDTENLEGIRIRTGSDGGFFMLRKSLHDPIISLQVEGTGVDQVRQLVVEPLHTLFTKNDMTKQLLDLSVLEEYGKGEK